MAGTRKTGPQTAQWIYELSDVEKALSSGNKEEVVRIIRKDSAELAVVLRPAQGMAYRDHLFCVIHIPLIESTSESFGQS